jgi:hypothetical protein
MPKIFLFLVAIGLFAGCSPSDPDEILRSGKRLYSQFDEELIIRHFFEDRRNGFFLDVGAYHWRDFSTTYYLDEHLGWSGIAIDAQSQFAAGYVKNRPRTRFFAYIVTDHSGTKDKLFFAGPISSTVESHLLDVARESGGDEDVAKVESFELKEVLIPTITLNELLDANDVTKIDFLSMDIEQGEPAALAGFDIERFKPELVCIEAFGPVRDDIADYFERHDYEPIEKYREFDDLNWYFAPKGSTRFD